MFSFFKKKYTDISPEEFKELKKMKDTVILDVRARSEQIGGVINGQRNMNLQDPKFKENVAKLDKSKTYLLYCRSGARSRRASKIMSNMGFDKVYNLKGGFLAWEREFG